MSSRLNLCVSIPNIIQGYKVTRHKRLLCATLGSARLHSPAVIATLPIAVFTVPVMTLTHSRAWTRAWGSWRLGASNALLILWLEVGETLEEEGKFSDYLFNSSPAAGDSRFVNLPAAQESGSEGRPADPSGEKWLAGTGPAAFG